MIRSEHSVHVDDELRHHGRQEEPLHGLKPKQTKPCCFIGIEVLHLATSYQEKNCLKISRTPSGRSEYCQEIIVVNLRFERQNAVQVVITWIRIKEIHQVGDFACLIMLRVQIKQRWCLCDSLLDEQWRVFFVQFLSFQFNYNLVLYCVEISYLCLRV